MASSGFLVSPKQDPSKEQLWTETWKRIDRFLPDLRGDLALEEPEPEPVPEPEQTKTEPAAEEAASAKKEDKPQEQAGEGAEEAKSAKESVE
jgi:golgi-specific brefeldin A-resistance guanine nucleotide exchange factor 1